MNTGDEVLSFMDLLDLDEELVDKRLKTLMVRDDHSKTHLTWAIQLLKYKQLINDKEEIDCENDLESDFVAKLIKDVKDETIECVCKITNIVLRLNPTSIASKSEHLLQQILSNFDLNPSELICNIEENSEDSNLPRLDLHLKLCDSILDAVIENNEKLYLPFLETPLENILQSSNENLKTYFLTNTVPRFFEAVTGYAMLDRIWNYLQKLKNESKQTSLKVLSCLSNFYLPTVDNKGQLKFESEIVHHPEFWNVILHGMMSNDAILHKFSVYLMKRSIDCICNMKANVEVKSGETVLFIWKMNDEYNMKQMWNNYFILIDSLEEKQSNIVLPSLQLFAKLNNIGDHWLNCVFNMGLKHDNAQVRLKCIEYRLDVKISNTKEAYTLLEALNDLNLYDHPEEYEKLNFKLAEKTKDLNTFCYVFEAMPLLKWSPVPFFYLSRILAGLYVEDITKAMLPDRVTEIINELLKIPCNNLAARKAIHINISHFVGRSCMGFKWQDYANIYPAFKFDLMSNEAKVKNPLLLAIKNKLSIDDNKMSFFKLVGDSHMNVDFGLLYLDNHYEDLPLFLEIINDKISRINDIANRQYSNKIDCFNEASYISHLYRKTVDKENITRETINTMIAREIKTMIHYVTTLIVNEVILTIDECKLFFREFNSLLQCDANDDLKDILLQLYKTSVVVLKNKGSDLNSKVLCTFIVANMASNLLLKSNYKHEMFDLKGILEIVTKFEFGENKSKESNGRLKNIIYEKSCEIIHYLIEDKNDAKRNLKQIDEFVENVIECGGYGCLKWTLRIVNKLLPLLSEETVNFNVTQFINNAWREIEELKSNNQYAPCMKEFIGLITQDVLLKNSTYNNIILFYCNKVVEYGPMKNTPLYFLVRTLNSKDINSDYGQIVYILCEMLLFSPVPRKDQRIAENVAVDILHNPEYAVNQDETGIHFNFQIQFNLIIILCKISDPEIIRVVSDLIIEKINKMLVNKCMYHGHSQPHRTLMNAVQHLLLILVSKPKGVDFSKIADWCMSLLGRMPHQPSVRICLEWYTALYLYMKHPKMDQEVLSILKSKKIPLASQLLILYWILKHKISNSTCKSGEFEYVMATLLSHTMGQVFSIRLQSQYLASKLYQLCNNKPLEYGCVFNIIESTFADSRKDKNFLKLQNDYFANEFDIIRNLTPCFIYYFVPRYCEVSNNENVDVDYVRTVLDNVKSLLLDGKYDDDFRKEWIASCISDDEVFNLKLSKNTEVHEVAVNAEVGTIQKKYVPWKNMSDIDVYEINKKRESPSDLIVVASLIDKLPNLGGMARTSEVFGVKTYVVDSLRHLQDKQFQGLSVSAERWVDIEEVRPGAPLKEYLIRKKSEGYSVVAAEQTSSSCQLQSFKFPRKTLLLLGHEKEGIPCDLLPMMDFCVEIPQQGFVRSLNVHVTAAIFVWEYARQNFL
ncbi:uncharacterized protein LOC125227436 [Leguminivora glycinivorella]|uniref:uncharacterized protein LOC125227436 n=1 Tax=Leguminivora glycinivorella TaxID=1035111 RepID=UPI00200F9338|nr:uncharacterized protein LOC125227436 [Leguminivora glycinivorella]